MANEDPRTDAAARTTDLPGYRLGKALLESARPAARNFTSSFYDDLKFATGETQWPTPNSFRAWWSERWKNRAVRNYTFGTIHYKIGSILGQEATIRCEPMNELVTLQDREDIAAAVRHELDRLRFEEITHDVMFDGAVLGKGICHVFTTRNPWSGMYEIHMEVVDPCRFYPDPSKSTLRECRYVVYEPELDMSMIRRIFPDTYQLVSPKIRTIGKLGDVQYTRSEDEIIYGPTTGEFGLSRDGALTDRKADVAFIWIKDDTVAEDLKTVLERPPLSGLKCGSCGYEMERGEAYFDPPMDTTKPHCPKCGGAELQNTMLPPVMGQEIERRELYPYGRLIAMTDTALLYDDQSPYQLEEVFPFAEYNHYRISRRYWGFGEVALLKKSQQALNKNIAQGIDFMRLAGNGPMEVPAEVPAYRHLGNIPGDQVPVPAAFMGMARYITPNGYNPQMHQIIDHALLEDFQRVSGVTDISTGVAPQAPTSGVEVKARMAGASTRMVLHMKQGNQFRSDAANIVYQMERQFYTEPRAFNRVKPNGELESIVLEMSQMPKDIAVKVSASLDKIEKDNLFGQNLMMAVDKGQIPFMPDLMLPLMGADPEVSREIQSRLEQMQAEAQAAAAAGVLPPEGGAPPGEQQAPEPAAEGV